jgi:hypothetical protein
VGISQFGLIAICKEKNWLIAKCANFDRRKPHKTAAPRQGTVGTSIATSSFEVHPPPH